MPSIADLLIERILWEDAPLGKYTDKGWLDPHNTFLDVKKETHDDDAGPGGLRGRLQHGWVRQAASDAYSIGDERDLGRVVAHVRHHYPKLPEITVASPQHPTGAAPVCMLHGKRGDRAPFGTSKCGFRHEKYL